jgi:hypothetical protein
MYECGCVQIVPKRKMPDGMEASLFSGGSQNPDGSIKRKKTAPEDAKAKKQAARTQRAASKAALRTRWLKRRETLEGGK